MVSLGSKTLILGLVKTRLRHVALRIALLVVVLAAWASPAKAQDVERDETWGTVSSLTTVGAVASQVLMPRLFYSAPSVTVGWRARWHVSALAPVGAHLGLVMLNEDVLKSAIADPRPGCDDEAAAGLPECRSFGMVSSHAFSSFAALGNGVGVFIFDTTKWSDGQFSGGAFAGHVVFPLIMASVSAAGRGIGNYETGEQIIAGATSGIAIGFLTGMTYSLMQTPECGYSGSLICW
jgi:hypothetical protein